MAQAGRRARPRGCGRSRPAGGGAAVSSAVDGRAGLAEELRRRRTALGWTWSRWRSKPRSRSACCP